MRGSNIAAEGITLRPCLFRIGTLSPDVGLIYFCLDCFGDDLELSTSSLIEQV